MIEAPQPRQPTADRRKPEAGLAEVASLKRQADEYLKGWQRAKADYLNLQKRTETERVELVQFANAALLMDVLPLYDSFKRALNQVPKPLQADAWVEGLKRIQSQYQTLFRSLGLDEIPTVGQPFDPELHEAVAREHRAGVTAGQVLAEASTGFRLHGRVLIPAKVTVSE